jgi:hypothetical protein
MLLIVGIIVTFILVVVFSNPRMRGCRWREDRRAAPGTYRCAACGAHTVTADGKPPRVCLADQQPPR